jgi:hypothetical protein
MRCQQNAKKKKPKYNNITFKFHELEKICDLLLCIFYGSMVYNESLTPPSNTVQYQL